MTFAFLSLSKRLDLNYTYDDDTNDKTRISAKRFTAKFYFFYFYSTIFVKS